MNPDKNVYYITRPENTLWMFPRQVETTDIHHTVQLWSDNPMDNELCILQTFKTRAQKQSHLPKSVLKIVYHQAQCASHKKQNKKKTTVLSGISHIYKFILSSCQANFMCMRPKGITFVFCGLHCSNWFNQSYISCCFLQNNFDT